MGPSTRRYRAVRRLVLPVLVVILIGHTAATAQERVAPPLPPPSGLVIPVASVTALQNAVDTLVSGTTILVQPGVYRLTRELRIRNGVTNVALRGATANRADVVLLGSGMEIPGVNIPLKVENARDVLIANLSIGETYWHPIQLMGDAGADRVRIYNVRLFDAGQQFLKSSVNFQQPDGVDDVTVEYSLIEYTNIGPSHGYTEGIDVHHGANWVIRYNVFRNIRVPPTARDKYRPAILMWSGSRDTIVHSNTFIDCERAIIFGLGPQQGFAHSHAGGAIYNNFIYRIQPVHADAGISIWDSPGTKVYHNTVIQNGTYPNAIEYRFPSTTGVHIVNNLTDGAIRQRDGAQAFLAGNYTQATPSLFSAPLQGDLHLLPDAAVAIDKGYALPELTFDWDGQSRPAGGGWDIGADEYVRPNRPPAAQAIASVTAGPAPLTVLFDGSRSSDPDGDALFYHWSFGTGDASSAATASYTFTTPGSYVTTLTVTDVHGATGTASIVITVKAAELLAAPGNLRAVVSGRSVQLTWVDQSSGEHGFAIERAAKKSSFVEVGRVGADVTSFVDAGVSSATNYEYRVRAFRTDGGVSSYSNVVQVRVK